MIRPTKVIRKKEYKLWHDRHIDAGYRFCSTEERNELEREGYHLEHIPGYDRDFEVAIR